MGAPSSGGRVCGRFGSATGSSKEKAKNKTIGKSNCGGRAYARTHWKAATVKHFFRVPARDRARISLIGVIAKPRRTKGVTSVRGSRVSPRMAINPKFGGPRLAPERVALL